MKLLRQTCLGRVRIAACVDSNAIHEGKTFAGSPVLSPPRIAGMNYPIVICTLLHAREIAAKIRSLGLTNEIIFLGATQHLPNCPATSLEASL
jgi:hypothetical protein